MDENEIERQFAAMLSGMEFEVDKKSESYILFPLEEERAMLQKSFEDHYVTLTEMQAMSVDDFLSELGLGDQSASDLSIDDDVNDEGTSQLYAQLVELINDDAEKLDLIGAEVRVGGEGIFYFDADDENGGQVVVIEDGDTISGDVTFLTVAPKISYNAFRLMQEGAEDLKDYDDMITREPGVWMMLKNASHTSSDGFVKQVIEHGAIVPLEYSTLKFERIVRQSDAVLGNSDPVEAEVVPVSIKHCFTSEFILAVNNGIENDLNYNDYEQEELHEKRAEHQSEIELYMSVVDPEEKLVINSHHAISIEGRVVELVEKTATYLQPIIMNPTNSWRVAHSFLVEDDDGTMKMVQVLPEHIDKIRRLGETEAK